MRGILSCSCTSNLQLLPSLSLCNDYPIAQGVPCIVNILFQHSRISTNVQGSWHNFRCAFASCYTCRLNSDQVVAVWLALPDASTPFHLDLHFIRRVVHSGQHYAVMALVECLQRRDVGRRTRPRSLSQRCEAARRREQFILSSVFLIPFLIACRHLWIHMTLGTTRAISTLEHFWSSFFWPENARILSYSLTSAKTGSTQFLKYLPLLLFWLLRYAQSCIYPDSSSADKPLHRRTRMGPAAWLRAPSWCQTGRGTHRWRRWRGRRRVKSLGLVSPGLIYFNCYSFVGRK